MIFETCNQEYAARVRDALSLTLQGDFAYLNFPRDAYTDRYIKNTYDSIKDKLVPTYKNNQSVDK